MDYRCALHLPEKEEISEEKHREGGGTAETKEDSSGLPVPQCLHLTVSMLIAVVTFPCIDREIDIFICNYL